MSVFSNPGAKWREINMERDHQWAQSRLSSYIDSELPSLSMRRLHGHESICPECRAAIQSLRRMVSGLSGLMARGSERGAGAGNAADAGLPEATAQSVLARIEREGRRDDDGNGGGGP
jgi:anti-sigma factor RsiW